MTMTVGMRVEIDTPPAKRRDVDDVLADPAALARAKASHTEGLRKLATAAEAAIGRGATWDEIQAVILRVAQESAGTSTLAASARARTHGGDDSF